VNVGPPGHPGSSSRREGKYKAFGEAALVAVKGIGVTFYRVGGIPNRNSFCSWNVWRVRFVYSLLDTGVLLALPALGSMISLGSWAGTVGSGLCRWPGFGIRLGVCFGVGWCPCLFGEPHPRIFWPIREEVGGLGQLLSRAVEMRG